MADAKTTKKTGKKGVIKDAAFFAAIGRKGGMKTKRNMMNKNPNYYSQIGTLGGETMKQTRGKEFYSKIGSMSKRSQSTESSEAGEE